MARIAYALGEVIIVADDAEMEQAAGEFTALAGKYGAVLGTFESFFSHKIVSDLLDLRRAARC